MSKTICVYSSSSDAVGDHFFQAARQLGAIMGERGDTLVYGGACIGLMGEMARAVHQSGGKVVGIIPKYLAHYDITYDNADELILTEDMRERKAMMEERSDAFISLPGGFGTLEETMEILTLKQVQQHNKPIVIINTGNFYDHLIHLFELIYKESFAKSEQRHLYSVVPHAGDAMDYIDNYQPLPFKKKWF